MSCQIYKHGVYNINQAERRGGSQSDNFGNENQLNPARHTIQCGISRQKHGVIHQSKMASSHRPMELKRPMVSQMGNSRTLWQWRARWRPHQLLLARRQRTMVILPMTLASQNIGCLLRSYKLDLAEKDNVKVSYLYCSGCMHNNIAGLDLVASYVCTDTVQHALTRYRAWLSVGLPCTYSMWKLKGWQTWSSRWRHMDTVTCYQK